jgi:YVTN family beta-propeller protein
VTVIDGATNAATNISGCNCNANSTESIAVNPLTNKIYVGSANSTTLFIIDGATNTGTQSAEVDQVFAVAVNPVTNMVYLSNSNNNVVTALNGATNTTTTVNVGSSPAGLDVDPVTNKVYVANNGSNNVTVIDGANNSTTTVTDPSGTSPAAVVVNPLTNTIYVLNDGSGAVLGSVTVIDGATNAVTNITANVNPSALAVNPTTNKIYATSNVPFAAGDLLVIDGATNAFWHISLPGGPRAAAVNPETNKLYIVSGSTTVIDEQSVQGIPLTTVITPLAGNQTSSATPSFAFTATSAFTPDATTPDAVYFQMDTWQGAWTAATPGTGGSFTGATGTLQPGFHTLYAYATDGQDASLTQGQGELGGNSSPIIGNIAAYGFLATGAPVNAPAFSASPSPLAFGSQTKGTESKPLTLTVTNTGTASLSITNVAEGGTDQADFSVSSDACNGATVTAGSKCAISVAFTPSTTSAESATLTFTDNASGSPQAVNLTGAGTPTPVTVTTSSLPSGVVGAAYSQTLAASGGVTPYSWSVSTGTLPAGLSLAASTGKISGTPTTAGTSAFTVKVTDSASGTATQSLSITINASLAVTTASLPEGTVGTAYSQTLEATGGVSPYTWSISTGTLPAGLSLAASTGAISGTPTTAGSSALTVKVTDSASHAATQSLSLTINAAVPTATSTKLSASATSVAAGTSVTLTATVTQTAGTPTPTGMVTFKDGATTLGTGTLNGSGIATYTASSLAVGSHTITASYGGDSRNVASVSTSLIVTVTLGATTTALTASATSIAVDSSVTFTATVTGASGVPAPTGSVTFKNGTTTLGTGTLSSGTATYSTSSLATGSYSVTAAYGGDTNNSASTSAAVAVTVFPGAPNFSIALSPSSGSVKAGTPETLTVTVTSINGFNSATNLSCSGLPKESTCNFSEASITPAVSGTATSTLTIKTDTSTTTAALDLPGNSPAARTGSVGSGIAMANVVGALLLLPILGSRRRKLRHLLGSLGAFLLLVILASAAMTGCGSGPTTPAGTYSIQITAESGSITQNATFSLTVQ